MTHLEHSSRARDPMAETLRGDVEGERAEDPSPRVPADVSGLWFLEGRLSDDGQIRSTPIRPLPFRMGRHSSLSMVLTSPHASKQHAEIYSDGFTLRVRDLGSRNGTFLNGRQASDEPLHEGDVLHLGGYKFRLVRGPDCHALDTEATVGATGPLTRNFVAKAVGIRHLIAQTAVTVHLQPIVTLPGGQVVAYEALGRGRLPGLPESPVALFEMAGALGPEAQEELSQLFRFKAVDLVRHRRDPPVLFLNTHPVELERRGLLESLKQLRSYAPGVDLVLEIHESALAQADFIGWLRNRMSEINVGLAYDDFGAGQARLLELAEAPPHYLKFDRRLVAGMDRAPTSRQRLVASLVAAARELCVKTIAEGVETADEAAACVLAGFSHAQGYHLGRPAPVDDLG